jgi:hypothetical protein
VSMMRFTANAVVALEVSSSIATVKPVTVPE